VELTSPSAARQPFVIGRSRSLQVATHSPARAGRSVPDPHTVILVALFVNFSLFSFFLSQGVSGGTASGKTTVCDMIIQQLHDHRVVLVNQVSVVTAASAAGLFLFESLAAATAMFCYTLLCSYLVSYNMSNDILFIQF
jgi:hypothetical protein